MPTKASAAETKDGNQKFKPDALSCNQYGLFSAFVLLEQWVTGFAGADLPPSTSRKDDLADGRPPARRRPWPELPPQVEMFSARARSSICSFAPDLRASDSPMAIALPAVIL